MHASGIGVPRPERVRQVARGGDPAVRDFGSYVPVGDAAGKLTDWQAQGTAIQYLSSHQRPDDVARDVAVLRRHGFPPGRVWFRQVGQSYADLVQRSGPDVLIEDDCESLGSRAETEMITPQLSARTRRRVVCIVVPEFGGIDHLPSDVSQLPSIGT